VTENTRSPRQVEQRGTTYLALSLTITVGDSQSQQQDDSRQPGTVELLSNLTLPSERMSPTDIHIQHLGNQMGPLRFPV